MIIGLKGFSANLSYAVEIDVFTTTLGAKVLENVKITLDDGENKQVMHTNGSGNLTFAILPGKSVTVTFEKEGYISKKMLIDASSIAKTKRMDAFEFIMTLKKKRKNVNYGELNFPIVKIFYCNVFKRFKFDKAFNTKMGKQYKEMCQEIERGGYLLASK